MAVVLFEKKIRGLALKVLQMIDSAMVMLFSIIVLFSITQLLTAQAASGQLSPALRIPMQYVTIGIFLGMAFFTLFEIEEIVRLMKKPTSEFYPQEKEEEQ